MASQPTQEASRAVKLAARQVLGRAGTLRVANDNPRWIMAKLLELDEADHMRRVELARAG